VTGDEDVEGMGIGKDLQAGIHQLGAHHHGKEPADETRDDSEARYIVPMSLWFVE
jgi:hypothetical protein